MAQIKSGDTVKIITREITPDDTKSGLYFSYFGGLVGKVDRIYDDGSACIDIDLNSLTADMRERHLGIQEAERKRWLENISDEMRNRLSKEQKQLKMSYKILVGQKDLEIYTGKMPDVVAVAEVEEAEEEPKRLSEAEISAAEEEFLNSRKQQE